jgi:hypothetical protein
LPLWNPKSATTLESYREAGGSAAGDGSSGSDESSSSSAAAGGGGGKVAAMYREPGTPSAGVGVCVLDDERGRFECTTTVRIAGRGIRVQKLSLLSLVPRLLRERKPSFQLVCSCTVNFLAKQQSGLHSEGACSGVGMRKVGKFMLHLNCCAREVQYA